MKNISDILENLLKTAKEESASTEDRTETKGVSGKVILANLMDKTADLLIAQDIKK